MLNSLDIVTIGELIKGKREVLGINLSELSRRTGINKGIISKIESGETKRPELRTLKPIADVLNIPYEEIMEWYIKVEDRYGMFYDFLLETAETSNLSLMEKVAIKFLENPNKDTYELLEDLFKIAETFENTEVRLTLYNVIIMYARTHGVPKYTARGLCHKYLIEREDLKRLEESFKVGEEVLHYVEFLSDEEKIRFLFRMSLHAHNIKKYSECIELCTMGINLEKENTELKARAYLSMINSLYFLGLYDELEKHLIVYKTFNYHFINESASLTLAIVKTKKKEYDTAIPLLMDCLQNISKDSKIHAVNELIELYLQMGKFDSIAELIAQEEKFLVINAKTPYKYYSMGLYYQFKGTYQMLFEAFQEGLDSYINSMSVYGKINAYQDIMQCMKSIFDFYISKNKNLDLQMLHKLQKVYNGITNNKLISY
ncbi:helix-turn-helix domain-containing protein [Brevibacillus laterosporus]|uniref:Helix-turn-helix transcriptional regulator n=1 Tax=Brevibacillus laterosporus TaxID=1465 RepID=A0AAP3DLH0_BRELA|nr:helix-turn-helix transcriptional regulator [Brevibacillus laterosporus]MCR8982870.1 helix-turn-helix domain-containing protein [Brevibacillus laterosporus]MCZ0810026.1 helix-turn-helix transcriptional regulator [Brevibacillus laterosporus]MCZ0828662.1 helix-turn-helix transcriptional regulator [Brevibacillus laterosporus]MCZ0852705.1 helix-turn-helix transcriptional regulator [Brevibacillus laterosporus]